MSVIHPARAAVMRRRSLSHNGVRIDVGRWTADLLRTVRSALRGNIMHLVV